MIPPKSWSRLTAISIIAVCFIFSAIPSFAEGLTVYAFRDFSHRSDAPGSWAARLNFNNPVFLTNLKQSVAISIDGKKIECEMSPVGDRNRGQSSQVFLITPKKIDPAPVTVSININKGLTDVLGSKVLQKPFVYEFQSVEQLSIQGMETYFRSVKDKGFNLLLSGSALDKDILKAIKITPRVSDLRIRRSDEGKLEISGDFVKDENYRITILPITTNNGTAIFEANEFKFKGPGLTYEIGFQTDYSIVELRSRQYLPLKLSGVSKVRCELKRIPVILIPEINRSISSDSESFSKGWKLWESRLQSLRDEAASDKYLFSSRVQEDAEIFFAPDAADKSVIFSAPLSFRESPQKGGAWLVKFSSPDQSEVSPAIRLIQITDLAISYKLSAKSLLVWVTSLHSGDFVSGVNLGVVTKDGKALEIGKSDENGLILVKGGHAFGKYILESEKNPSTETTPLALENISWLIAAKEDDYCAIEIDSFRIKPGSATGSEKTDRIDGAQTGYIFTDRGIYRPGDEVNFKFISRIFKDNKVEAPAHAQVKTQITGPRGDVYYSREQKLNQFGSCYDSLKLETYWPVGNYNIKSVFTDKGTDQKGFTRSFSVQEYKESRHFVSLTFSRDEKPLPEYIGMKAEEEFLITEIAGSYFSGGPVRHGKVRWKAELAPVTHSIPGYDSYFFGDQDDKTLFLESGESVLDQQGKLSLSIPLDTRLLTGIYGVRLSATVVDIDGQPATEVKFFDPTPRFLIGIGSHPTQVQVGYSNPLRFVLIDAEGKKVPKALVEMSLLQKRYFSIKKRDNQGNINDTWEEGWIKTFSTKQTIMEGEGSFQTEFVDPGDYLVSITFHDTTGKYTSQTLFKVGWEDYDQWVRGQKEESKGPNTNVLIALNQKDYIPGSTIEATFHTPREVKRCLMTLERSDILDYQVVDVNGQDGGAKFLIQNGYQPNVFVSLLAPAGRSDLPVYTSQTDSDIPAVFSGYANAAVKTDLKRLRLEIAKDKSALKAKPGEKVTLDLAVLDQSGAGVVSEIAVCVVNEAVLAMTDFSIPDLSSLVGFNLPLSVRTGDLRLGLVSQDLFKTLSTRPVTGGGVGKALMGSTFRKDFRPVAYFNPAVITNEKGKASITFTTPDSLTAYRIFAVATDKSSGFVSADRSMVVTKDFYVEPALPRFLCPGDHAILPVSTFNNTSVIGAAFLKLNGSENLSVKPTEFKFDSPGHSTGVVYVDTTLGEQSEKATLEVTATFNGGGQQLSDAVQKTIPTRSLYTPVTHASQGNFAGTSEISVNFPDYVQDMVARKVDSQNLRASLTLSLNDWSRITPSLKYLRQYPYGCIEQISSSVIPLVGLRNLIVSGQISEFSTNDVDDFLKSGVDKILGSQQLTGGFSYWPGQLNTTLWASTYATFALLKAKNAGMKVPESNLNLASKFLKDSVFKKSSGEGDYRSDADRHWTMLALAETGAITSQDIQPFFSNYEKLSEESKALLLLASNKIHYLSSARAKELAKKLTPRDDAQGGDSLKSPWSELAACLMATLEIEGHSKKVDEMAGKLLRGLKPDGRWISTADTGWCLLAISNYFKQRTTSAKQNTAVNLVLDCGEKEPKKLTLKETSLTVQLDPVSLLKTKKLILKADSPQFVNYCFSLTYPDDPSDRAKSAKGLTLNKKIENLNGKEDIKVGDIVRISLDIGYENSSNKRGRAPLEFLALEDFTPAGFTPINSELKTEGLEGEALSNDYSNKNGVFPFYPSYVEIRDDGVRVFKNEIYVGLYRFSYLARAVTAGKFWIRGSRISAMYDPDISASIPGGKIEILQSSR